MVARIWEGRTRQEHAEAYTRLIEERDMPGYRKIEGFVKLTFLKRADGPFTYFKLISFWQNLEDIKRFTGPQIDAAVAYDSDQLMLVDFPGSVSHFEVFAD